MNCDLITVLVIISCIAIGAIFGFGKVLKFMTNKVFGKIVAVFICYTFGGIIISFDFIVELMEKTAGLWAGMDNIVGRVLNSVHFEVIIYYAVLFVAIYWIMKLLAALACAVLEIDVLPVRIVNQVSGAILFTSVAILVALFAFQIIYWVGGATATEFAANLEGSKIGLDKLFWNNPLLGLVEIFIGNGN